MEKVSSSAAVEDFCRRNQDGFRQYLNAFVADRILLSPVAVIVVLALLVFSVLNGLKYGWVAGLAYGPVLLLIGLFKILFELGYSIKSKAILWANGIILGIFLGFDFILWNIVQSGTLPKLSSNGSMAIILLTTSIITISRSLRAVIMKTLAFVFFEVVCLYLVAPELLVIFKMEIIFGVAFSLATDYLKNQVFQFYYYHTETGSSSLMHAYSQLQKLVFPHQLDLMKVGFTLEETMPVGSGEATVICYDIQNSSRIPQEELNRFIQLIMERCHDVFSKGYRRTPLQVTAFKLKEMGDGFISIVGFPFPQPGPLSAYETAIQVALQCQSITNAVRNELGIKDAYCSIGIASGLVHSFYTRVGIKVYDVYGQPLLMARRYEEFRKQYRLQNPIPDGDIICVQARTLEACSPELQKKFHRLELDSIRLKVRDDNEARHVYVAIFDQDNMPGPLLHAS